MEWKKVASTVGGFAPLLGAIFGGPLGGTVGTLVAKVLGTKDDPTSVNDAITAALGDPVKAMEFKAKMAELEMNHRVRLEEILLEGRRLELQGDQALLADTANARQREVALSQAGDRVGARATHAVALIVTLGFFLLLYTVLNKEGSEKIGQAGILMLGTLAGGFGAVVQYYLGSSLGSVRKTEALAKAARS